MRVLITGGCGFLGVRLARTLLAAGGLCVAGSTNKPIDRITLLDRAEPPQDLRSHPTIDFLIGDLNQQLEHSASLLEGIDLIFHLAAAVSGECEADFDLGMRSNIDATRALLEAARRVGGAPMLIFSSSVAVFGGSPEQPLPATIEDDTLPTPQNSYGTQKFIGEQLVADYTRKGYINGRSVRLMTVSVRAGAPNAAASSFLSGIVREPLAGLRVQCPVSADTQVALASPSNAVAGLMRAVSAKPEEWGARIAVNLPALRVSVREMVAALGSVAGDAALELIEWKVDPKISAIVTSWPSRINASRARRLGLGADESFEAIVAQYIHENPKAIRLPLMGNLRSS